MYERWYVSKYVKVSKHVSNKISLLVSMHMLTLNVQKWTTIRM